MPRAVPRITKRTATEHAGCVSFQKLCNACGPAMAAGHLSDEGRYFPLCVPGPLFRFPPLRHFIGWRHLE